MRACWFLFPLFCSLLLLSACFLGMDEQPYYTRAQALQFFADHQTVFTETAQEWQEHDSEDSFLFNRQENGRFYWNATGLACNGAICRVRTGNGHETAKMPFAAAAALAGVKPDKLRHWMTVSQTLNLDGISTVGTALPTCQRYVELRMRGSSRIAYGFLFIPDGHGGASRQLKQDHAGPDRGFTYLQPINDHWAYFEARS